MGPYAEAVHGISTAQSNLVGVEEIMAVQDFADLLLTRPKKVCHNYDFDAAFVEQLFQRNMDGLSDEHRSVYYLDLPHYCTMKSPAVKSLVGAKDKRGRIKWPKLEELHTFLFGESFDGAHDAMVDVKATRRCFYEMVERGVI